jgi:hypothetical protein
MSPDREHWQFVVELDALNRLRAETAAGLGRIAPALLAQAFRGEL